MKLRPPLRTSPTSHVRPEQRKEAAALARRLMTVEEAQPGHLSEHKLSVLVEELARFSDPQFNRRFALDAMERTRPAIRMPKIDQPIGDLRAVLAVPEVDWFWQRLKWPRGPRGQQAWMAGTRAALFWMAWPAGSPHATPAAEFIRDPGNAGLRSVFSEVAGRQREPFRPLAGPTARNNVRRLADEMNVDLAAMKAIVAMLRRLREREGFHRVGRVLHIDGLWIPAWVPQRGNKDPVLDDLIGRNAPEARLRIMVQANDGKLVGPGVGGPDNRVLGAAALNNVHKAVRGFLHVAISDAETGLPVVWVTRSLDEYEPDLASVLLKGLHDLWPDIGAEALVGDAYFDIDALARDCELHYGIHPVFRRRKVSKQTREARKRRGAKGPTTYPVDGGMQRQYRVSGYTHRGQLLCRLHGVPAIDKQWDIPTRDGLKPGEPAKTDLRLRAQCPKCVQAGARTGLTEQQRREYRPISLPAKADWNAICYFPHHPNGRAEAYAMRVAMQGRLGRIESLWNAVKAHHGLAGSKGERPRKTEVVQYSALLAVAYVQRAGLVCAGYAPAALLAPSRPVSAGPNPAEIERVAAAEFAGAVGRSQPVSGRPPRGWPWQDGAAAEQLEDRGDPGELLLPDEHAGARHAALGEVDGAKVRLGQRISGGRVVNKRGNLAVIRTTRDGR